MSTNRLNWLTRTASILIVTILLIPMFFGGVRSVQADVITVCASGCDFTTIQAAIIAANPLDVIDVKAGTYVEQVTISKNLTLQSLEGAIVKGFANMSPGCTSPSLPENHPIMCVNENATVTIDGFTIDGDMKGDTNVSLMGIAVRNAGGTIQNNTIVNIRPPTVSNTAGGTGIHVYNTDTALRTVTIVSNLLQNFNENGISITTSDNSGNRTEFLIDGNTIEGIVGESSLYNSTVPQNGIQVRVPAGGGIIQNNTISKIAFNNNGKPPFLGVSILNTSTPTDSMNNIITGAQAGIVYFTDTEDLGNYREISGNQIQVFKPGTVTNPGQNVYGILVSDRLKDTLSPVDPPALTAADAVLTGVLLSVAVKNNTISYTGTLSNTNTFGIEIEAGIGTNPISGPVPGDNILSVDVSGNHIYGAPNGFDAGLVIYQCDAADLPIGTVEFCGAGYLDTSHIVANDISGNNYGVIIGGPITSTFLDDFHHNRIAGNGVGVQNNTGSGILMINNWWGCNEGPGAVGCDTVVGNLLDYADPWLILSTTAAPTTISVGGTSTLTADLKWNSIEEDTSLLGSFVRDGIPVTFSVATLGSVNPLSGGTLLGAAPTTFTAPFVGGIFQVCATVDNEEVCSDVTEEPPLMIFLPLISK
jgi:nitrous oxidase accessory protein NosD